MTSPTIIPFPGHHWARCTNKHCYGCHLCAGGLASCTRCHGFEGGLPTDCPGDGMNEEQHEAVYAGTLDFVHGRGWVAEPSINSPARYR